MCVRACVCVRASVRACACMRGVSAYMCFDGGFVGLRVKDNELWLIPCSVFKYIYLYICI